MSRKFKVRSLQGGFAVLILGMGVTIAWNRYTHPDLRGRSTDDLRWEAITIVRDHSNEPILLRLPAMERQEQIAAELGRRLERQILAWQAEDRAEEVAAAARTDSQAGPRADAR
jgi:hypothetical protein